jgi:hypothetical protein
MAVSASSVASFVFCGVFAISVVASSLRRTVAAARTVRIAGERHATSQARSRPLRCKHPRSIALQSSYRLGNAKETTAVKDFFIIVNRLRTIANVVHSPAAGPFLTVGLRPRCGQTLDENAISGFAITSP